MNATQTAYAIALAAYETAVNAATAEGPTLAADATDAEWEAADDAYEAARVRHNVAALRDALRAATDAMVTDRTEALCRVYPKRAAEIRTTREQAMRLGGDFAARIIDMSFRAA